VSTSKSKTPEASRIVAAPLDSEMEMGRNWNGFYNRIAYDNVRA
jgi:hypothetical protein